MVRHVAAAFFLSVILAIAGGPSAFADTTGVVAGDSLGVGVSMASHLRSFAKNSVSIRSGVAIQQIREAPPGATLFLSLGTNDAVGSIVGLDGGIERILAAAKDAQVRLVWIGPPCVFKPWDKNAIELDAILKKRLGDAGVTYVSMRDDTLCNRGVRGGDGVHFNMRGYYHMWDLARGAAGFVVAADTETHAPAAAGASHKVKKRRPRRTRVSRHIKSNADAAPAAPAAETAPPPQ